MYVLIAFFRETKSSR